MFPQDNGGQPAPQPMEQPAQQPAPQQPAQQPAQQPQNFSLENLILDNPEAQPQQPAEQQPAQQPQEQPQQPQGQPQGQPQEQPQGQPQNEPLQVNDPYAGGGVRTARESFEKYLDEKFPIKGKLDINSIDKKDPEAFARFMNDMQEASRNDMVNTAARERAEAEFQNQIFEPVYQVFPKLKQDAVTDGLVRMIYKGAAADNPNISPVQVVQAFSNYTRQLYNAAVKSAQANIQQIPVAPAGQQGRAATKILNNEVVQKYAGGSADDVAQLIASMQGQGVGGL